MTKKKKAREFEVNSGVAKRSSGEVDKVVRFRMIATDGTEIVGVMSPKEARVVAKQLTEVADDAEVLQPDPDKPWEELPRDFEN